MVRRVAEAALHFTVRRSVAFGCENRCVREEDCWSFPRASSFVFGEENREEECEQSEKGVASASEVY
ncbi:hypothetical protein LINGRAHAP2_LOCUS26080 [Linum grandiflorum]